MHSIRKGKTGVTGIRAGETLLEAGRIC